MSRRVMEDRTTTATTSPAHHSTLACVVRYGLLLLLVLAACAVVLRAAGEDDAPFRIEIEFDPHGVLRWDRGQRPALVVWPRLGDGWIAISQRYAGRSSAADDIRSANPGLTQPMRDRQLRVPVDVLRDDLRLQAVRQLFPVDRRIADGWEHWVLDPFDQGEESWRWLAELFTGNASNASSLRETNPGLPEEDLERGRPMVIPAELLLPAFGDVPAPPPTPTPAVAAIGAATLGSEDLPLSFGADDLGPYAQYRLKRGEALYSAVVVRFTGQLIAKEVNATAHEIAERSGIDDVTSIPVGYPVRIPLDLLLPRYLPPDHPRRRAWEAERRELAGFLEVIQATDLSGVHVVIDAGHGGADSGASVAGLWESTYVYDIACRIRHNLERHTRATVWMTRKDASLEFSIPESDALVQDRDQYLLTDPRYRLRDSVLGVHLRWYLTNDIVLNKIGDDVPRSKTVFLSVHADSLHPSVRGAMIYVPSRVLRPNRYTVRRQDIKAYAEYRAHPTVRFGADFKARVEASSRHMADKIISSLERNGLEVHDDNPVRGSILRGRRSWVPAVLRYTAAQNALLLETCNLANPEDRKLLVDRKWREEFARGVVEGMAEAFNSQPSSD
jgi:N-acetylmuramoyl-L-alanine amidase